ncbi:hypothetical protein DFH94DRAFT_683783 [Russula ochroleuca]|uniref:Uncharacterized protein n=1 Tax=Russula ochroleuca TaxID=152965 RepID=A0A9P5T5N3_9AGAM|nr:hypothetical protein DFH94DRAFT_683783 [Russula ochroleuca]
MCTLFKRDDVTKDSGDLYPTSDPSAPKTTIRDLNNVGGGTRGSTEPAWSRDTELMRVEGTPARVEESGSISGLFRPNGVNACTADGRSDTLSYPWPIWGLAVTGDKPSIGQPEPRHVRNRLRSRGGGFTVKLCAITGNNTLPPCLTTLGWRRHPITFCGVVLENGKIRRYDNSPAPMTLGMLVALVIRENMGQPLRAPSTCENLVEIEHVFFAVSRFVKDETHRITPRWAGRSPGDVKGVFGARDENEAFYFQQRLARFAVFSFSDADHILTRAHKKAKITINGGGRMTTNQLLALPIRWSYPWTFKLQLGPDASLSSMSSEKEPWTQLMPRRSFWTLIYRSSEDLTLVHWDGVSDYGPTSHRQGLPTWTTRTPLFSNLVLGSTSTWVPMHKTTYS